MENISSRIVFSMTFSSVPVAPKWTVRRTDKWTASLRNAPPHRRSAVLKLTSIAP